MTEEQLMNYLAANPQTASRLLSMFGQTTKNAAVSPAVIPPHGPASLLNLYGLEPGLPSAMVMPRGIEDYLEMRGHVRMNMFVSPLHGIMTGQTDSTGDNPTTACSETAPTPGDLKICTQTHPFGVITMNTKPVQLDEAGQLLNRGEMRDYRLLNNPFMDLPDPVQVNPAQALRSRVAKNFLETTIAMKRDYAREVWTGDPANTAGNSGGYTQYRGLNGLVNTGYQDSTTGIACPAADSLVVDRASAVVQTTPGETVQAFVETYRDRKALAEDVGLNDVEWVWVMRRQAYLALTEIWPCAYYTYRCFTAAPTGTGDASPDLAAMNRMREEMQRDYHLLIDGERIPVWIDNTLAEDNAGNGDFESDVFLLPIRASALTDTGGQALYMEYFDYSGTEGMATQVNEFYGMPQSSFRVTPDGRFALAFLPNTSFCVQAQIRTRKRVILKLPFLAARLDNMRYQVYHHEREWQPGTSFYVDGGLTSFYGPTYEAPVS